MGFLFGGSTSSSVTPVSTLTGGQRSLLDQLTSLLGGQLGQGTAPYPGTYTPGPSGTQTQLFDLVSQLLGGQGPNQQQGQDFLSSLMQPYNPATATKEWSQAVQAPMEQDWSQNIVPQILEQFAGANAGGSGPAMKAVAESGKNLETNMGGILAQTLLNFQNQSTNQGLAATGQALNYPMNLIKSLLPAANTQYGIEAAQGQEQYQDWSTSQPYNNPWLQLLSPALNTKAVQNVPDNYQQGAFGDILKSIATLGGAYMMSPYQLFS